MSKISCWIVITATEKNEGGGRVRVYVSGEDAILNWREKEYLIEGAAFGKGEETNFIVI